MVAYAHDGEFIVELIRDEVPSSYFALTRAWLKYLLVSPQESPLNSFAQIPAFLVATVLRNVSRNIHVFAPHRHDVALKHTIVKKRMEKENLSSFSCDDCKECVSHCSGATRAAVILTWSWFASIKLSLSSLLQREKNITRACPCQILINYFWQPPLYNASL